MLVNAAVEFDEGRGRSAEFLRRMFGQAPPISPCGSAGGVPAMPPIVLFHCSLFLPICLAAVPGCFNLQDLAVQRPWDGVDRTCLTAVLWSCWGA